MLIRRLCSVLILIAAFACFFPGLSAAAVIAPGLRNTLQSMDAGSEVPVIINLSDRADLKQVLSLHNQAVKDKRIPANNKSIKRDAIVRALKEKAVLTQGPLRALLQNKGAKKIKAFWITNAIGATVPASLIGELLAVPGVESIEQDSLIQAPEVLPTAAASTTWNISRINAPDLWSAGITGTGVVVASLDTGVDVTHPDLQPKWRGGGCASPPYCDSWFDPYTNSTQPYDRAGAVSTGHGTGTMGIMVGSSATDYYGVAPEAKWIAAKIFNDSGSAEETKIVEALQWILAPGGSSANAPDVVNNSWGYSNSPGQCIPALPNALQDAIQNIQTSGIHMVFSAGNSGPGPSTSVSPANYPGSFAVGATDFNNVIASFSSRGPSACDGSIFPHVVAPGVYTGGVGIYTAAPAGQYQNVVGSSIAAPHVSGAAALLTGIFPALTPDEIVNVLEQTALPLVSAPPDDTVPNNIYGHGLIDVKSAYLSSFTAAKGNVQQIASIPQAWTFGDTATGFSSSSATFQIANQGTLDLVIDPSPNGVLLGGPNPGDFVIAADNCSGVTLPSLGSCSVSAYFRPGTIGSRSALLQVASDDPNMPVLDIPLSGIGVPPFTVALVHAGVTVGLYSSILTAYEDSGHQDIIKMRNTSITESPDFNRFPDIAFSLLGGYDSAFGTPVGFTTIQGAVTISRGEATIGNVIVQ